MKNGYFVFFISILFIATLFAGAELIIFNAYSVSDDIVVEWQTKAETNVRHFIIERKTPETSFIEVITIEPKGDNSFYSYRDESAYKQNDFVFIYQLKIVDNNGQVSRSEEIPVTSKISGFQRTWGSIKAMFR